MSMSMLFLIIVILFLLYKGIKIVPEYKRIVVLRLGKVLKKTKGPGVVFIIPIIDKPIWIDIREKLLEIPKQTCITKDNAPIDIDFIVYYRVIDPISAVVNVNNYEQATINLATTTLRAVIGNMTLDDVLSKREEINATLQAKLDEVTERWGVKVSSVEIREITPPRNVLDAMTMQMAAERERRAMIAEAEGKKESQIRIAEGEKQAAILKAEGEKEAMIRKAEGYAAYLEKLREAARNLDENSLTVLYIDSLEKIASSDSTKFVFPYELLEFLKTLKKNS